MSLAKCFYFFRKLLLQGYLDLFYILSEARIVQLCSKELIKLDFGLFVQICQKAFNSKHIPCIKEENDAQRIYLFSKSLVLTKTLHFQALNETLQESIFFSYFARIMQKQFIRLQRNDKFTKYFQVYSRYKRRRCKNAAEKKFICLFYIYIYIHIYIYFVLALGWESPQKID